MLSVTKEKKFFNLNAQAFARHQSRNSRKKFFGKKFILRLTCLVPFLLAYRHLVDRHLVDPVSKKVCQLIDQLTAEAIAVSIKVCVDQSLCRSKSVSIKVCWSNCILVKMSVGQNVCRSKCLLDNVCWSICLL